MCECPSGWEGDACETNIDDCDPNPCQNGAFCTDFLEGFTCTCPPGFDGDLCEVVLDRCDPNPCQNGGTCNDFGVGFYCICQSPWVGTLCEECGELCGNRPDYYRERFITCVETDDACNPAGPDCETTCATRMACEGPLDINSHGYGTVVGPDRGC